MATRGVRPPRPPRSASARLVIPEAVTETEIKRTDPMSTAAQVVHLATEADWVGLLALRYGAERRLREKGTQQWVSSSARGISQLAEKVRKREVMIIRRGVHAVGCFSLTRDYDPALYGDDPANGAWLYLGKVITAPDAAHTGVGEYVVRYAVDEAKKYDLCGVRINVWSGPDGEGCRQRWAELGFKQTGEVRGQTAGTLMELAVEPEVVVKGEK